MTKCAFFIVKRTISIHINYGYHHHVKASNEITKHKDIRKEYFMVLKFRNMIY